MKVKVGDKIWDGSKQLVMVILSPADKLNIAKMLPDATMYCEGPDGTRDDEFQEFMKLEEEQGA